MSRIVNLGLVAAMIAGAVLTYDTKHRAEEAASRVAELRLKVEREKQAITLLRAEWSVLTQPRRLQELVERYGEALGLKVEEVKQIVTIDEVPTRPLDIGPDPAGRPLGGFAGEMNTIR